MGIERDSIWKQDLKREKFLSLKLAKAMHCVVISCIPPPHRVQLFQRETFGIGRNDKDLPICRTLSKHWGRGEGGGSQISDICSIIFPPSLHICFYIWYHFCTISFFSKVAVEREVSYVTQKVFLLHDLLPQPVRLKSPETVVGLQDLAKKLKVFPFLELSLPM